MEALNYQETIIVGKALKSCDPDMIKRMRYDGYRTGAKAVVEYVLNSDPDSIMSIVEYLVEEGDLPEGTEREVFDELYENTTEV